MQEVLWSRFTTTSIGFCLACTYICVLLRTGRHEKIVTVPITGYSNFGTKIINFKNRFIPIKKNYYEGSSGPNVFYGQNWHIHATVAEQYSKTYMEKERK